MGLIELRRIEASREIASTLAKSPNVAYLPGDCHVHQLAISVEESRKELQGTEKKSWLKILLDRVCTERKDDLLIDSSQT
ncbi:Prohibitin-3, mitochondrial, partial [Cucurbita argyrosperma subsp. argyrosperma]